MELEHQVAEQQAEIARLAELLEARSKEQHARIHDVNPDRRSTHWQVCEYQPCMGDRIALAAAGDEAPGQTVAC